MKRLTPRHSTLSPLSILSSTLNWFEYTNLNLNVRQNPAKGSTALTHPGGDRNGREPAVPVGNLSLGDRHEFRL